jgi:enoyl-CoA hydratase
VTGHADRLVRYEVRSAIAYITLDRSEVLNAINPPMLEEIAVNVATACSDERVRAIVFRGAGGRAFSAGVDLAYFAANDVFADAGASLRFTGLIRDVFRAIETAPLPTVAVIEGFALAGGLELALCCDFIICADECRIGDQHANYHLMPGAGATQRLPRRIGVQRASYLLYSGQRIDGIEAMRIGLALHSAPAEQLDAQLEAFVSPFRDKSRAGLAHMKRALQRGLDLPISEGLDYERLTSQEFFSCYPDARDGLAAFIGRRA